MQLDTVKKPEKFVYFFAQGDTEGNVKMRNQLGGKGANLAEMTSLGIPVPPGFTISTDICQLFYSAGERLPDFVQADVKEAMGKIETRLLKKFGDNSNPLLVSVRSGARVSMPGMMDTILNLGLNDQTVEGLATRSGNPRFAWDSYRRFIQMYSNVVMGMNFSYLEVLLEDLKHDRGIESDQELTVEDLKGLVENYKIQIERHTGQAFPMEPWTQLWGAISAVFRSWNTPRAVTYRELNGFSNEWGTAVNIQSMVFGNMGEDSATGVAFTRDPSTGEHKFFGEFLVNAQGEDVVAGIRTPQPITKKDAEGTGLQSMEEIMPKSFAELEQIYKRLETHYRDMQDIEFTIEQGKLWMLQTRSGKRTARAALRIACDMIDEKLITAEEALMRIDPMSLDQLLHPTLDPNADKKVLAKGLPASPGGVAGKIVFTSEDAAQMKDAGEKVILVRVETSPEDIHGMIAAEGILTSRGGMTSHAAVVARGMGKCCVAGCSAIEINYENQTLTVAGYTLKRGEILTLDGSTGEVILGHVKTIPPQLDSYFERIMALADQTRKMGVRANADTPQDAAAARAFGAEGIGLCRTEHMFFGDDRINAVREMILADSKDERKKALDKLLPMQREDFVGIFEAMSGLPVTIRLLDPPLHEFLPHSDEEIHQLAKTLSVNEQKLAAKVRSLAEFNPMLGHRGCRLAITFPEIYLMQTRAIAEAACAVVQAGTKIFPEIMIPLVMTKEELLFLRGLVKSEVERVQRDKGVEFKYLIGTMLELPRATLIADQLAEHADFFSFGTNDLTQTTLGLSRDDAGRFLATYVSEGILPQDPFVTIDQEGVGRLVQMGVDLGRKGRPDIKLGVCGEHGGDPQSIEFFSKAGLHYVSCSPFRLPVARLSAARAQLKKATSQ